MTSGRAERAVVDWEVGPTNGVVEALIEALVDPKLHARRTSNHPPCEDTEKSIARQMHAVVLLYNYYHRKQKLELEFLDFESFSKLAMSLRPSLIPFMKMSRSESVGLKDQLSVTEEAIKDACKIAMSLDASKDAPIIEGHPISKVAVLLIDSKRENCWLQFGAITEGVWSLLEKEITQETLAEENVLKKRKTNNQKAPSDGEKFLQFGFKVVEDVLGIDSSNLEVLETHVVHSLSKEGSAAQFYMMQYSQSINIRHRVSLKFLTESLNGPLADKFLGSWSAKEIVTYFHMLPYVGFISDWLQRKDSCLPSLNGRNAPTKIPSLSLPEYNSEDIDTISFEATENSEDNQEKDNYSSGGKDVSSVEAFPSPNKHRNMVEERKNRSTKLNKDYEKHERGSLLGPPSGLSQSVVKKDNALTQTSGCTTIEAEERKKANSKPGAYRQRKENVSSHQRRENVTHDSPFPEDGVNLKVQKPDVVRLGSGDVDISCNQSGTATKKELQSHNIELEDALSSAALAMLERKRQNLYTQICTMEDKLALYEYSIERIRAGGETEFARKCIKFILSGSDHFMLKNGLQVQDKGLQPGDDHNPSQKKTGFFCTFFPGKSSCQDLECICDENNWRMPRYFVRPSDGKFISDVVVESEGFSFSSKGCSECSPHEARESAAAQMIAQIRDACANQS